MIRFLTKVINLELRSVNEVSNTIRINEYSKNSFYINAGNPSAEIQ